MLGTSFFNFDCIVCVMFQINENDEENTKEKDERSKTPEVCL